MIELGGKAKDKQTGFVGSITAQVLLEGVDSTG